MKKSDYTESQIVKAIKECENGKSVNDLCRALGVSNVTFYKWKSKFGGMQVSDVKQMKDLEEENSKLKRMFANLSLHAQILYSPNLRNSAVDRTIFVL